MYDSRQMVWNAGLREETLSDDDLAKKISDLDIRIGKIQNSQHINIQYLNQLLAAKQQLANEYWHREDMRDAPPEYEEVIVGGEDDTGLTKQLAKEQEKIVAKKRKRRKSGWDD